MSKPVIILESIQIRWPEDDAMPDAFGCIVRAQVSYPVNGGDDRRLEWLSSGGIWGIERPDAGYRAEIELEQLEDLREHLRAFGVSVRNFAQIAGHADIQE